MRARIPNLNINDTVKNAMLYSAQKSKKSMKTLLTFKLFCNVKKVGIGTTEVEKKVKYIRGVLNQRQQKVKISKVIKKILEKKH